MRAGDMRKVLGPAAVVLLVAFVAALAWGYVDCHERGGVLVPGVILFECLRLLP